MHLGRAGALCALLVTTAASAQSGAPLDVTMQLAPATILLGEPAWVDVTVTNRSSEPLRVEMGNTCFGEKEITVHVPEAEPFNRDRLPCGVVSQAGSCLTQGPLRIEAGATLKRRYVLRGDFRITHAGRYTVMLEKKLPYGADRGGVFGGGGQGFPHLADAQPVQTQLTLNVLPADHNKLLQIEQAEAAELAAPLPTLAYPPGADITVIRQLADERSKLQQDAWEAKYRMADGVIEYPTAGMEPIFSAWLDQNNTTEAGWGLRALSNLNTPASRKILARQAASPDKPQDTSFQIHRWEAVEALGNMGDTSYVPLLERLTRDSYHDVQRSAVRALGRLGGGKALAFLNTIALQGKTVFDRQDAIMAMGDSGSLQAVPFLINLFTLPDSDQPGASNYALWTLTHVRVLPTTRRSTPQEAQRAWLDWWSQNQHTARAYGPYDCADLKNPSANNDRSRAIGNDTKR